MLSFLRDPNVRFGPLGLVDVDSSRASKFGYPFVKITF